MPLIRVFGAAPLARMPATTSEQYRTWKGGRSNMMTCQLHMLDVMGQRLKKSANLGMAATCLGLGHSFSNAVGGATTDPPRRTATRAALNDGVCGDPPAV